MDDLRAKLDAASLLPRGKWKELWIAAADEFCAPARPYVDRALASTALEGAPAASAFVDDPQGDLPRASRLAWRVAFNPWVDADRQDRNALQLRAKAVVAAVARAEPDVFVPLYLGALDHQWQVRHALERASWHDAHPLAVSLLVNCVRLSEPHEEIRDHAFFSLGRVHTLPCEARGAMWLLVWSDPRAWTLRWDTLARLREPAAIAAALADGINSWEPWEPRPALARALIRIVVGEDPWLAQRRESDYPEAPSNADVVLRAVAMLPRVASQSGLEDAARLALDTRWPSFGLAGAISRGLLGCADALPGLVDALSAEAPSGVLPALTAIALEAKPALEKIRATPDSDDRTLALAAIDPRAATLDALVAVVERRAEQAHELRSQFEDGLISSDEYARWFDPADAAVKLWQEHGATPEREAARQRLANVLGEHASIHGDTAIRRLRGLPAT